jgi:hypothetical protein
MKKTFSFISLLLLIASLSYSQQLKKEFRGVIKKKINMGYLLHLPVSYMPTRKNNGL